MIFLEKPQGYGVEIYPYFYPFCITFGSIANVESKKDEILGLLANSDSTQIKDVTTSITSPSDIELGLVSIKVYDADTN